MIELMIINYILQNKSLGILYKYNLKPSHFIMTKDIVEFILKHYRDYDVIPDALTVATEFPNDFEVVEIDESEEYMVRKLQEINLYNLVAPVIKEASKKAKNDSFEAVEYLKNEIKNIMQEAGQGMGRGTDIIADSGDRLEEYRQRMGVEGLLGIPTGIKKLDNILHGWLKEDLVVIFGRTNEGKSWVLLYFLVMAWRAGFKVLLYSGELSKHIVGFRFDTLNANFSNMGLMMGEENLGASIEYGQYITELQQKEGFIVVTQKDFGGRKPTVDEIEQLIEVHSPDIVGLDQLTLMEDRRKGENKRIRYTNIAEDLYSLTEKAGIPIITVTQANRENVKDKKTKDSPPELHDIAESDGIAQNAKRVLSIKVVDKLLKISIKKNTYGLNNQDVLLIWDVNYGKFQPLTEGQTENMQDDYGF